MLSGTCLCFLGVALSICLYMWPLTCSLFLFYVELLFICCIRPSSFASVPGSSIPWMLLGAGIHCMTFLLNTVLANDRAGL